MSSLAADTETEKVPFVGKASPGSPERDNIATTEQDDAPLSGEAQAERVGLADLLAVAGQASDQLGESTGVIYGSSEEFLAHLDTQPYEPIDS